MSNTATQSLTHSVIESHLLRVYNRWGFVRLSESNGRKEGREEGVVPVLKASFTLC